MKHIPLGRSGIEVSSIGLGCMRMDSLSSADARAMVQTALDQGIDFFDHADIYGAGRSEEIFADACRQLKVPRSTLVLQSKCGIRQGLYDSSAEHILASTEGILKRLKTDYLDLLLLHRPDALMEPAEVAAAFDTLHRTGKVRAFGVSNFNPVQIAFLQAAVAAPLAVNQLQMGLMHTGMIDAGLNVNMKNPGAVDRDGGVLDYCQANRITVQAWSPFMHGFFEGIFLDNPQFPELNAALQAVADARGISTSAVAIAWLLRHPAAIVPIVGTMNPGRLKDICKADQVTLTRPEWYQLYLAAGNKLP